MSNTFEFAERLGFSPPLQFDQQEQESVAEKFYWTGDINFQKLIDLIKSTSVIRVNRPETLFKGQIIKIGGYGFNVGKFEDYLLDVNNNIALPSFFNEKSRTPLTIDREEFYYNGYIFNAENNISKTISKSKVEFAASINIDKQYYRYRMLFPFNGEKGDSIFDKYALIIETDSYYDFESLVNYLGLSITANFIKGINDKFQLALDQAKSDCNVIDEIYEFAPDFVIAKRDDKDLWKDLVSLSQCGIDRELVFSGTDENIAVLNIITNFSNTYYLYNQFWKFPEVLNELIYRIDKDYRLEFLQAISTVFIKHWKDENILNAIIFNLEPVDFYSQFEPKKLEMRIASWCGVDEKKNKKNYEIGYTVHVYDDYSPFSSQSKSKTLGWLDGISPVKAVFKEEETYIPAFSAAYFTQEDIIKDRQTFINDYVLSGFLSAPSSVIKTAVATAKSAQAVRAYAIRSKIAKRFKEAIMALKRRIKKLNKKINKKQTEKLLLEATELVRKQKVDELYKKGYNYVKVGMPSRQVIAKLFPKSGTRLVIKTEKQFNILKKSLSNNAQRNLVLLNGTIYRNNIDIIAFHTNFHNSRLNDFLEINKITRGKVTLADVKRVYRHLLQESHIKYDMHPFIEKRLIRHFEELKKGIKFSDNYKWEQTGGIPGIHAEMLSINEVLHRVERILKAKNITMTEEVFSDMLSFNKNLLKNEVMTRCADCNFLSYDVPFIEQILK